MFACIVGRNLNESVASGVDTSNLSVTTPSDSLSPMSPLSPAHSANSPGAVNVILPGMPNLCDEDGNPLNNQQQLQMYKKQQLEKSHQHQVLYHQKLQELSSEQEGQVDNGQRQARVEEKEVPIYAVPKKKRSIKHEIGDTLLENPVISNGFSPELKSPVFNDLPAQAILMECEAPNPPPRNYNSQYRTQFHSRQSSEELLVSPCALHKLPDSPRMHTSPQTIHHNVPHLGTNPAGIQVPSPRGGGTGPEQGSVAVSRSNSTATATDQSLLELADELGAGNSAASVHSSLGRLSQEGVGSGRPGSGQRSRRSQDGVS